MTAEQKPTPAFERARSQRAGLRRALGDLEAALATPAARRGGAWATDVAEAMLGLRAAFDVHVATTESPDGVLAEIVQQSPRLANAVERLQAEHVELERMLAERMADVQPTPSDPDAGWVEAQREALTTLLVRLVRHRQRGADLTFEAYGLDVGGES